jgi:hypothetical protein
MMTFEETSIEQDTTKRSGLATVALICSLIICCPITTVVGPILGLIAFFSIKNNPQIKGKGFAISAVIVGLFSTVIWVIVLAFSYNWTMNFLDQVGETTTELISAGYDNNYSDFRSHLTRNSVGVSDDEINEFIKELKSRYGNFDSAVFIFDRQVEKLQPIQNESPFPLRLVFETTDVTAECMYEILPKSGLEVSLHIDCIVIRDDKNGDIAFPKGSYCDTSQSEQNKKEDEVVSEPTS